MYVVSAKYFSKLYLVKHLILVSKHKITKYFPLVFKIQNTSGNYTVLHKHGITKQLSSLVSADSRTRTLHISKYKTISTSKFTSQDKNSFFPCTILQWNSLNSHSR